MAGVSDLIVVTGPPGAGETTVARFLSRMFEPSALVAGDDFFAFIDQGYIAPWTAEAHQQNEIVVEAAGAAVGEPDGRSEHSSRHFLDDYGLTGCRLQRARPLPVRL